MTPLRIAYVGAAASGRSTSLEMLLRSVGLSVPKTRVASAEHPITLPVDGNPRSLVVAANKSRGWSVYDPSAPDVPPGIKAEVDALPSFDGFILLVDSRSWRVDANVNENMYEALRRDLAARGRDISEIPILFQVNFRDEPDAVPLPGLTARLPRQPPTYVESVARVGTGVVDAVQEVVRLIDATRAAKRSD